MAYGSLPKSWSRTDSEAFFEIALQINNNIAEGAGKILVVDKSLMMKFAHVCRGQLNPMAAIIGGIVGQEITKACSGNCSPIFQFLYFDASECLPKDWNGIKESHCQPSGSRYDGQVNHFYHLFLSFYVLFFLFFSFSLISNQILY